MTARTLSKTIFGLIAATSCALIASAHAAYPDKPVRLIVVYPAGGTTDAVARSLAEKLTAQLGQTFIVENKGGAGGAIGMDAMAKAAADGYTLAISAVSPITLLPHLGKLSFDPVNDIAPVASVMYSPVYVLATPAFTGKTFADVLAQSKAKAGAIRVATSGIATLGHIMVEQIKAKSGLELIHVPYKGGGQVVTDAAGGQFELFTTNPSPAANGQMQKGTLRVLAVGAPQRLLSFANVPTLAELGFPEANLTSTFGVFAPAKVPADVIARLHVEIAKAIATPDMMERLIKLDNVPAVMGPADFTKFIRNESALNAKVVRERGIKAD
jgi:tripartite-type tricarboxylate transporter receptor subunit TctC